MSFILFLLILDSIPYKENRFEIQIGIFRMLIEHVAAGHIGTSPNLVFGSILDLYFYLTVNQKIKFEMITGKQYNVVIFVGEKSKFGWMTM